MCISRQRSRSFHVRNKKAALRQVHIQMTAKVQPIEVPGVASSKSQKPEIGHWPLSS